MLWLQSTANNTQGGPPRRQGTSISQQCFPAAFRNPRLVNSCIKLIWISRRLAMVHANNHAARKTCMSGMQQTAIRVSRGLQVRSLGGQMLWNILWIPQSLQHTLHPEVPDIFGMISACRTADEDGGRVHDLLGTRCDPYVRKLLTDQDFDYHCHSNLTRAVLPFGLTEFDVHDVLNVFQCTGKPCPVPKSPLQLHNANMLSKQSR